MRGKEQKNERAKQGVFRWPRGRAWPSARLSPGTPIPSSLCTWASPSFPHEGARARVRGAVPVRAGFILSSGRGRAPERDKSHRCPTHILQAVPASSPGGSHSAAASQGSRAASLRLRLGQRPHGGDLGGCPAERLKDPARVAPGSEHYARGPGSAAGGPGESGLGPQLDWGSE